VSGSSAFRNTAVSKNFKITEMFRQILKTDGVLGLFTGLAPALLTTPIFWGVYFPIYEHAKAWYAPVYPKYTNANSPMNHILAAVSAGAVADVITNPFWVIRTRMQTASLHNLLDPAMRAKAAPVSMPRTVVDLYKEGGPMVFWRGLSASLFGLSHVAVQFPVYEMLKKEIALARHKGASQDASTEDGPVEWLLASASSKVCASLLTYPHEVVRSRMMDSRAKLSLVNAVKGMIKNEGYQSFYNGIHVSLLRVIPNCCLTFISYELFSRWGKDYILKGTSP
jgi:solute carrier family 25 folate transporter 32